jgi:hypothetical protein
MFDCPARMKTFRGFARVLAAERTAVMSIAAMSLMVLWFTCVG